MAYKDIELCIVTLAKHGSIGATKTSTVRIKNKPINVIDTSGAGATFSAGFISGYLKGWKLNECMLFASAAANLKCINHDLAFFELDDVLKNYHTSYYEIEN
jgi:sugar/nucleoside kinase (ribokinase family)